MDAFKLYHTCFNKIRLFTLYWRRIVFATNHHKCPFFKKVKANICGGFTADQWMLYDFDHNDRHEYLSEFDWYRSRYINEPFDFVCNNKIVTAEILKQYTRVPESFAIKSRGRLSSFESVDMEYEEVYDLLKERGQFFFKPFDKGKGTGVVIMTYDYEQDTPCIDFKPLTKDDFMNYLKKHDDWFISEAMKQCKTLDGIYDKTVNTIRFITMKNPETEKFEIFFAVQRIGTSETIPVDNGSRGGLVANIDLETGVLSEARCLWNRNVYEVHPDSKAPIKGVQLPNWQQVKKDMLELANKMPYMHFIAWDILLTEEGHCIIEANTSSGVNIIQLWGGQRNKQLGAFYRAHNVIK